jgi:hypothetical protein
VTDSKLIEVGRSELDDLRQCPLKHKFRWREGWYVPEGDWGASEKAEKGTQWAAIMATHWREKQKFDEGGGKHTVKWARFAMVAEAAHQVNIYQELHDWTDEEATERLELLTWMIDGYLERWGVDPDWEVLEVEARYSVPIADPDGDGTPEFLLRINPDLVVRSRKLGRRIVIDGKTVEARGIMTSGQIELHGQLASYMRGLVRLDPDDPPIMAMLDQVRRDKLKTRAMTLTERFSRPITVHTPKELDEIERDALSDLRLMFSPANLARPSSHPEPRMCGWKCEFQEAHIALRKSGGDWSRAVEILSARGMSNDRSQDPALRRR